MGGGGGGGLQVQIICQNVALLYKGILKLQIITNIASLLPKSFVPNRFQPEFQKASGCHGGSLLSQNNHNAS